MKLSYAEILNLRKQFLESEYKEQIEELDELEKEISDVKITLQHLESKKYAIKKPITILWQKELADALDTKIKLQERIEKDQEENDHSDEYRELQNNEM